jgi:hypothetical protein
MNCRGIPLIEKHISDKIIDDLIEVFSTQLHANTTEPFFCGWVILSPEWRFKIYYG